ncbi:unnamed protein product [Schistosoma spindalis]|nr:unnamed protein product [Schistosoma spindale]
MDRQSKSSIFTTEEHLQLKTTVCQPTSKSEFSIQMSRQFYCMGPKPGKPRNPSFRRYRCLLTVVYAKYFGSVGRTLLATTATVGENKSNPSGGRNQEEALEVDRIHIEESTELRHKTSHHMESSRSKEER